MPRRWYVVQSKSNYELTAYEHLRDQRFKVFYPQIAEDRIIRGKRITQFTPLFPCYLFVAFDIKRAKWRSILGTRGVVHLLGSSDTYASPLPKGFVEDLIRQVDGLGTIPIRKAEKIVAKYGAGDRVRVSDGLYKGLSGTCQKIQDDFAILIMALQSGDFEIKLPLRLIESV